jgi:hypothetical protein
MPAVFEQDGIRFLYPENWTLERTELEDGWSVTVQSPDTAFFSVTYEIGEADMASPAESALNALQEEYPMCEFDSAVETLAGQPAVGYDVRFYSLDLTNTAWIRSFACEDGCVLVLCEVNDLELDRNGPVLKAICKSLVIED